MTDLRENLKPIEFALDALTSEDVSNFAAATHSQFFQSIPPSFATRFRKAEFEWLNQLKVDMRTLLHVEQEYEYLSALFLGIPLNVSSRISEWKERRSMTFVTIETNISQTNEVKIKSSTTFLLQNAEGGTKSE